MATADLLEIAGRHLSVCTDLHRAPDIPPKKLRIARRTHRIHLPPAEPVLLLYDATLFGSADEGFLATPERLCWRNLLASPKQMAWRDLDPSVVVATETEIAVCGSRLVLLAGAPKPAELSAFFVEVARATQAQRAGPYRGEHDALSPGDARPSARQVLRLARRRLGDSSWLYFAPSIPPAKAKRVREVHGAHLGEDEEVLVLYDSTVFGSAEEGALLTRDGIYYKNGFQDPGRIDWTAVDPDRVTHDGDTVQVGETRITFVAGGEQAGRFAVLIRELARRP